MDVETTILKPKEDALRKGIAEQQHRQWLHNATTLEARKIIDTMEEKILFAITDNALSADKSAEFIRLYSAQLKLIKQLKRNIYDTEVFIARTLGQH